MAADSRNQAPPTPIRLNRWGTATPDEGEAKKDTNGDGRVDSREEWEAKVAKSQGETVRGKVGLAYLNGGQDGGEASGAGRSQTGAGVGALHPLNFSFNAGIPRDVVGELADEALKGIPPRPETAELVDKFYLNPMARRVQAFIADQLERAGLPGDTVVPSLAKRVA